MPLDEKLGRLLAGTLGQFARPEVTVPTLPEGFSDEEVRRLLSLVLADAIVFQDYLAATYAGFWELPVAVHDKWFSIDEPDVPVEVVLQQGPAGLDATGLARLAMSGPMLEHWDHVLSQSELYADHGPGGWFFDPLVRHE